MAKFDISLEVLFLHFERHFFSHQMVQKILLFHVEIPLCATYIFVSLYSKTLFVIIVVKRHVLKSSDYRLSLNFLLAMNTCHNGAVCYSAFDFFFSCKDLRVA